MTEVDDSFGNIVDDDDDLDDDIGNRIGNETSGSAASAEGNAVSGGNAGGPTAPTAYAVLKYISESLATDPEAVSIATEGGRTTRFKVRVDPGDMGRMIGRRGRVAQSIRTLVRVAGSRDGAETNVDFVDD